MTKREQTANNNSNMKDQLNHLIVFLPSSTFSARQSLQACPGTRKPVSEPLNIPRLHFRRTPGVLRAPGRSEPGAMGPSRAPKGRRRIALQRHFLTGEYWCACCFLEDFQILSQVASLGVIHLNEFAMRLHLGNQFKELLRFIGNESIM